LETTFNSSDVDRAVVCVNPAGTGASSYLIGSIPIPAPQAPPKPVLSSPLNTYAGAALTATLSWNCAFGASTYNVHVNDDFGFTRDVTGIALCSYAISGLKYSTAYHWRVVGVNASGAGAWSDTWTFKTQAAPSGGCPYVFGWDGSGFRADNNILPESDYPGNKGREVTDYYTLRLPPRRENGRYELSLREFEREETHLDQIGLIAVDHADSTEIAVMTDGEIFQYTLPYSVAADSQDWNQDHSAFSAMDSCVVRTASGDSIRFRFKYANKRGAPLFTVPPEGGILLGGWALGILPGSDGKYDVRINHEGGIDHQDGSNKRPETTESTIKIQSVGSVSKSNAVSASSSSFTFRERPSVVYVPLAKVDTEVTVQFESPAALDYANLALRDSSPMTTRHLRLVSASHSRAGDVAAMVVSRDGRFAVLRPGESIDLQFYAPPILRNRVRSFILVSHGRYERIAKSDGAVATGGFSIGQNHPNPFNPRTTLDYDLAVAGHVVVSVYDLLGREISRLADEDEEAGAHEKSWDAARASSGVYYARIVVTDRSGAELYRANRKLLLVK
jgi:hypothetical protein